MAVMAREAWTDERLDDLKETVSQRFDQVETEIKTRFVEVDKRFEQVDQRFDRVEGDIRELRSDVKQIDGKLDGLKSEVNTRFDSMQRTMIICFSGMTASIVGALIVTQL
jgi:CHASE3 domain sensor protein